MLPDRIFVTGTDTGIGKTLISAILTTGLKAHYWKPIQSGTIDGTDTEWIRSVSKLPQENFLPEIYSLQQPLSPHAAAKLDGVEIALDAVTLPDVSPLIVEGAGGIMVPLNRHQYILDLMYHLNLPAIVVARSGLGTINHTLLTVERLRERGIEILGVVMNGPINPSNRESLEHYGNINVLAEIPHVDSISHDSIKLLFEQHFKHYFEPSYCFAAVCEPSSSNEYEAERSAAGRPLGKAQPVSLPGLPTETKYASHGALKT